MYIVIRILRVRKNEVLALWIGGKKSIAFCVYIQIPTDMKSRGVQDLLITVTDKPIKFTVIIKTIFPELKTQICVAIRSEMLVNM
ncbi:transposase [Psychroflexus sp. MES1-P1E]|uniref:transposase n=1 Tax=Psychroflexus sp. MES1-P1E TaxID=2058320 RepID=UPI0011AE615F|nr:transposase [Psychroflexus sp. MES1-P1E]